MKMLALIVALLSGPVYAQPSCGPRDEVTAQLKESYKEMPVGRGLAGEAAMIEAWANLETGTFTITATTPGGQTCLLASGEHWESIFEITIPGDPL